MLKTLHLYNYSFVLNAYLSNMNLQSELNKTSLFSNLELLANQVVEGFISGIHKSPFHGFSAEFAEHKIYNDGESTKHIDWKLFAKTDKLYTKRYEEETNLRCHMILDSSASMYYPEVKDLSATNLNKIGFGVLAIAALMNILKRQRDAVGLSVYSDNYNFYSPEKGSERHHQMLLAKLSEISLDTKPSQQTETYTYLHQIAENIKRRSLIFLFTDMFQNSENDVKIFDALRHLKYNKHEVILFHTYSKEKEYNFDFDNSPKKFVDVESGASINLYADSIRDIYKSSVETYFKTLQIKCAQYRIKYIPAIIENGFSPILTTFLVERQKFL